MKKWLLGGLILLAILIGFVYFYIPGSLYLHTTVNFPTNPHGFHRHIMNEKNWTKWWPGEKKGDAYHFNNNQYRFIDTRINAVVVEISSDNFIDTTMLNVIPGITDSVTIFWEGSTKSPSSPFNRIGTYLSAVKIKKDMGVILDSLTTYYSKQQNIYGIEIRKEKVVDSTLLQNFTVSKGYPDIDLIYTLIDQLQEYTASQSAKQTGFPMLNISTEDSITYITKVAIPVDKRLASSGNMTYKWMLGRGNILVADVKGGPAAIRYAFEKIEEYVSDTKRIPPAIPFESLITDRRKERDTSKWVTRIYYPVM